MVTNSVVDSLKWTIKESSVAMIVFVNIISLTFTVVRKEI